MLGVLFLVQSRAQSVGFGGGLRALKMEDEADLIDIVVSNNSSLSSNTEHHHPSADAMPQPLPNSVMKPPYIAL